MPANRNNERTSSPTTNDELQTPDRSLLAVRARQVTRLHAMFWIPRAVLNAGLDMRRAVEDEQDGVLRATATKCQRLSFTVYDELDKILPDLWDKLVARESWYTRHVRDKLAEGESGAKAEDNYKVKRAIVHWHPWSPPLLDLPKSARGLGHPDCAWFLAPITIDWNDEAARKDFIENGNPPMAADEWGRFVYLNGVGDPNRPFEGLLQGKLLTDAAKAILFTPSSVLPPTTVRPGTVRRGRKGIAKSYQLTEVTTGFIAYVAVVVRFALSSDDAFDESGNGFDYVDFYNQIREYLEAPRYRDRTKVLLDWWNKALFPTAMQAAIRPGSGERRGMLALLDADLDGGEDIAQ